MATRHSEGVALYSISNREAQGQDGQQKKNMLTLSRIREFVKSKFQPWGVSNTQTAAYNLNNITSYDR